MKVKCRKIISPTTSEDLGNSSPWLNIGKEYIVLALVVTPKAGASIFFQSEHYHEPIFSTLIGFEFVSQLIPSNWVTKIDKNNIYSMMPASWMYDGFFEELEDQTEKAMRLFKKESEIIYREEGLID